jgi:hypothetical protein
MKPVCHCNAYELSILTKCGGASAKKTELFQASTRKEGYPGRLGSVEMVLTGGGDANIRHFRRESLYDKTFSWTFTAELQTRPATEAILGKPRMTDRTASMRIGQRV